MIINADLHIHSKYSKGTSKYMDIEHILKYGSIKGLDLIATGDCLHEKWLEEIEKNSNKPLLLSTEVEDRHRVHHLIFLPSTNQAHDLRNIFSKHAKNIDADGRPRISLNGMEIIDIIRELGGLIGPAHAFTPWTSIYKSFTSIYNCYARKPDFIELGLSADTDMADMVEELRDLPFLSNSDAHSFYSHRLGREFNQMEVNELSGLETNFEEVKKVLKNNKIVANYGLDPNLGKYHLTACTRCFTRFQLKDAEENKFKCPECKGIIKKGVFDRTKQLSKDGKIVHPNFRPKYHKIIPLAEIISLSIGKNIGTKSVDLIWEQYIGRYNNEIDVLINEDILEIKKINEKVGNMIELFRKGKIYIYPGGGGEYGHISKIMPTVKWFHPKVTLDSWVK
ncbi:PHP domain protein [Methanococcus vannielii SB]|uniref:PHP domain protein n=1 Tax=Methanococcus vannielii (strain ATCC 35089 / DSM 1224 / JCM 13029 / OCM 148 / SB) TaxID=406327 RepID=A6UR85_METVS|nr:TIGR00375 family protein [Methanococcus vannielii]ABR55007.1 PHP domain protein [Methanococcus vannielii SB]